MSVGRQELQKGQELLKIKPSVCVCVGFFLWFSSSSSSWFFFFFFFGGGGGVILTVLSQIYHNVSFGAKMFNIYTINLIFTLH